MIILHKCLNAYITILHKRINVYITELTWFGCPGKLSFIYVIETCCY